MRSDNVADASAGAPALEADNVTRTATNRNVCTRMVEHFPDAAVRMASHHSTVLISIKTKCDAECKRLSRFGMEDMRAHQIMSRRVVTIRPEASIAEAVKVMLAHHVSGLPVVDSAGNLVGILCESDFLRRTEIGTEHARNRLLAILLGAERVAGEFVKEHGRKVEQVMTRQPVTASEQEPLEEVAALMERRHLNHVPVMRDKRIVGIITRSDFLSAVAGPLTNASGDSRNDDELRRSVLAALARIPWQPVGLNISVKDGAVTLRGVIRGENAHRAVVVACENIPGVRKVEDRLLLQSARPDPEDEYGGGDFVSLQTEPSTLDDEPL
jgi:CBS domain-containing protein